ncbi:diguanylate cyclase domain-containing protein [Roseibium salinum]|uniref:Diguanylate cyclase n=1 Tax=Roseibium salinum TaxID=1604349 RepID=A0ABT3R203_9HYPH|nr:diguanylate cyclase [Roseibium sp. DSM 29163]MCX2723229.1 diguanylate cyclase [Roseibium sp. DSM 29163]
MIRKKVDKQGVQGPDLFQPSGGRSIKVWIYGFAALLIVLSTASLAFIAHYAWREADRRALESEQLRMSNALHDYHRQIARDQIALAQWDETFKALQPPIDRHFVEFELARDLWEDFDLARTFIVDGNGSLIAQAFEDEIRFDAQQLAPGNEIRRLAEETLAAFKRRQTRSSSVFSEWHMPQSALLDIGASAFAVVDGTPALLSAMPVLPDEGTVELHADYPAILVNAVYLDEDWIAELNEQLSFRELGFYPGPPERRHPTNYLIRADDGKIFGYLRWDHAKPGREIWVTALPLIILLVSLIAVVAFALASKISRLSASLEESERKNHHFARHDALTGLPNRHHFSDCLAYSLDCLPEQEFAILACDLDRFKPVNDTHGHEAGDTVICSVAQRLRLLVGKHGIVSRIGGDEFIILLTGQTGRDHLASLAEQIGETVAGPIEIGSGQVVEIGVSIGIAIAPDCGSTEKELIRMADLALYKAKDNGRNGFEFAGPQLLQAATPNREHKLHESEPEQPRLESTL